MNHELEKYKFLLPDPYIGRGHPRAYAKTYQELLDAVQEGIDMYDWDDKEDLAAWFGQCTGSRIVTSEFKKEFV